MIKSEMIFKTNLQSIFLCLLMLFFMLFFLKFTAQTIKILQIYLCSVQDRSGSDFNQSSIIRHLMTIFFMVLDLPGNSDLVRAYNHELFSSVAPLSPRLSFTPSGMYSNSSFIFRSFLPVYLLDVFLSITLLPSTVCPLSAKTNCLQERGN